MVIEYSSPEDGIQNVAVRYLLASYNLFVFLASLLGDTTILIATTKYNAIKLNKVHVAIMQHLAVADLLMSIFNVFPVILAVLSNEWILGEFMCRLHCLVKFWLYPVVLALTCSLTTSKLLTVKFPFYSRIWTTKGAHYACIIMWAACLVRLAEFLDSFNDDLLFSFEEYSCFIRAQNIPFWCEQLMKIVWPIHIILIATVILTSLLLVVEAKRAASRNNRSVRWEGILTVILTGAVVVVSFGPIAVFWLIPTIDYSPPRLHIVGVLFNLNVMSNFFIYSMTVQSFRKFLKDKTGLILSKLCLTTQTGHDQT